MSATPTTSIRISDTMKQRAQEYADRCQPRSDLKSVVEHALQWYLDHHDPAQPVVTVAEPKAVYSTHNRKAK